MAHASSTPQTWFRDVVLSILLLGGLLGGLALYAGVWPPAVIVESGSMMHRDSEVSYGRYGTIDPGDLVLVVALDSEDRASVETAARSHHETYGGRGDVIVYYPDNDRTRTPIIHRAVAWVDVRDDANSGARSYAVEWVPGVPCPETSVVDASGGPACVFGSQGVTIPSLGLFGYKPSRDGFATKGDNPFTNPRADQAAGISDVVQPEWIEGKARGELPWIGLVKLALAKAPNEDRPPASWWRIGNAFAPRDLWVMLGFTLVAIVGVPLAHDAYARARARRTAAGDRPRR